MRLDYCLKTPLLQDPSTTNMLNRPKHSWEQNGSTFTIFTSILFLIETIYSNISRSNYLRNEKYFLNFFFHFLNLVSIWYIFKKRMGLIADVFLKFWTTRDVVRYMSKKSLFRKHLDKLHRNWLKHYSKLNDSTITTFIDPCERNSVWKSLSELYTES